MHIEEVLNDTKWPEAVDPELICGYSKEEKQERASDIIDILIDESLEEKSVLDFGTEEGYIAAEFGKRKVKKSVGFDINNKFLNFTNCVLTDDWDMVEQNGPYDIILAYDVIDHIERIHPVESLILLKSVLSENGKIIVRYHPFTSRHGSHLYKKINKAFIHLVLNETDLAKATEGEPITSFQKLHYPLTSYKFFAQSAGLEIERESIITKPVDNFFNNEEVSKQIKTTLGINFNPIPQMSLEFVDHVLTKSSKKD
jgi:hypothetical protein